MASTAAISENLRDSDVLYVGLTGGIGSGKSYVATLLVKAGIPVYDSDREAKRLMNEDPRLRNQISGLLGEQAYRLGVLDRAYVAGRVFEDKALLESLNAIVHPVVRMDFLRWSQLAGSRVVVQETALIFENAMESFYHRIVLVTAPLGLRLLRVSKRDGTDAGQILNRMRHQLPDTEKLPGADYCIRNILREDTDQQVRRLALHLASLEL